MTPKYSYILYFDDGTGWDWILGVFDNYNDMMAYKNEIDEIYASDKHASTYFHKYETNARQHQWAMEDEE